MFATLKNKIKEETGNEVQIRPRRSLQHYSQSSFGSSSSINVENLFEQKDVEINFLKTQLKELNGKFVDLSQTVSNLQEDNERLDKSNAILEESLKVAQVQKELIHEEQDKIQNIQLQEISKLKSLLHFREEEAIDRLAIIKQNLQQIEQLTEENKHLREQERLREHTQDELQKLRHSSQAEKNVLTSTLATIQEENRHLISKMNIYEESRNKFTADLTKDEKVQALIRERKLLEQRLEEAHLHLSDIKSTWSAQNLSLETQVSRLSHQVAAETTEKRKALTSKNECVEKIKELEFELEKLYNEITQRDNKIKILSEEIDDLSSALKETRLESEEETTFLRSKVKQSDNELDDLRLRLEAAEERLNGHMENSEVLIKSLRQQIDEQQEKHNQLLIELEKEKQEKLSGLLKNAEISQELSIVKQDFKNESLEVTELNENLQKLQSLLEIKENEIKSLEDKNQELNNVLTQQSMNQNLIEELNKELSDKNKTIKVLKQRLVDFKKTLQQELKSNNNPSNGTENNYRIESIEKDTKTVNNTKNSSNYYVEGGIVMDDVNFKYLKHVILKFLTSREVEARHLVRAVGTLLRLSQEEEKLLHDTISFKMSWFGTRPESILR